MTFVYGLLTATTAIIAAQSYFKCTLDLNFIYANTLGRLVKLFKHPSA